MGIIRNMQIRDAKLGYYCEDCRVLTFAIYLKGDIAAGSNICFGNKVLEGSNQERTKIMSCPIGIIGELLDAIGVYDWGKLPETYVRAEFSNEDWDAEIIKIGHILKETWFSIDEYLKRNKLETWYEVCPKRNEAEEELEG
jgi:hypothetical protein